MTYLPFNAQVVTDELWEARAVRFPEHTPNTREYYLLRSIFEDHFPSPSALATVPKVSTLSTPLNICKGFGYTAVQGRILLTYGCIHWHILGDHLACAVCLCIHVECANGAIPGAEHCMLDAGGLGMGSRVGGHT